MAGDDLTPKDDAIEKWRTLPQGTPSKEAMPPATGGGNTIFGLVIPRGILWIFLAMFIFSAILGAISQFL